MKSEITQPAENSHPGNHRPLTEPRVAIEDICVFCGSLPGNHPAYLAAAREVGTILAERGIDVVYGGGRVGLMGALADAALAAGGKVYGVIPEALKLREIAHDDVTELAVVPNMHVRKAQMAARSDAFLTLPGGVGTLEEFFEIFSWTTLGLIAKPLGILNINGYFNPLIALIDHAIGAGFMLPYHRDYLVVRDNPRQLIEDLLRFRPPRPGTKWIELQQT